MQGVCSATNAGVDRVRGGRRHGIKGFSGEGWRKMDIRLIEGIEFDATAVGAYGLSVEAEDEFLRVEIFFAGGLSQVSRLL